MIVSGDLAAAITASEWAEFFRAGASDLFLWLVLLGYVVIDYLVWHRTVRHSSVASETSSVQRRWRLLRGRNWLAFVQIPGLIGLAILGWLGLTTRDPGVGNMVTGLLWVIWWPALVFLLLLLGRGWCLVCPFGAISDLIQRFRQPVRQWPQRLRNHWIQTGLFVFLTWGLGYFDIFSSHVTTSWLLVAMAAASGLIGVFFVGRAFCRYLCPIGGMIGLYSLAAPYRLEVGCSKVPCTFSRECGRACARQELDLQLSHYDVGASLLQHPRRLDGAVQAFGLVGVTLMQTLIMTSAWQELLPKLAPLSAAILDALLYVALAVGVPMATAMIVAIVISPSSRDKSRDSKSLPLKHAMILMGYALLPVAIGFHGGHNLGHLLSEGPRVFGLRGPILKNNPAFVIQLLFGLGGMASSLYMFRVLTQPLDNQARGSRASFIFNTLLPLAATLAGVTILGLPMGDRLASASVLFRLPA
ncbi:MAG: 4Fe-4S binding protein [Syntrophothermus sp.]